MRSNARIGFGVANLAVAGSMLYGVFRLLPTRWWLVDGGALLVAAALAASGVMLIANLRRANEVTRFAAWLTLAIGLALFATLVLTASWLAGVYGPVGRGGAILFVLVGALVFPYVVVFPAFLLAWTWRERTGREAP